MEIWLINFELNSLSLILWASSRDSYCSMQKKAVKWFAFHLRGGTNKAKKAVNCRMAVIGSDYQVQAQTTLPFVFYGPTTRQRERQKKKMKWKNSWLFQENVSFLCYPSQKMAKKVDRKCQATNKSPSTIILTCFETVCGLHPSTEYEKMCYQIFTSEKNRGKKSELAHAHQARRKDRSNDKFASILIFIAIMNAVAQQPHGCGLIQNNFRLSHWTNNENENEKKYSRRVMIEMNWR